MSVNNQTKEWLLTNLKDIKLSLIQQLEQYNHYFLQIKCQLEQYVQQHILQSHQREQHFIHKIMTLEKQVGKLKEDNSALRNEHMITLINYEELINSREIQSNEKDQKVKELMEEVEKIKQFLLELQSKQQNKQSVNFDDNESIQLPRQSSGLQVIKQVSQHDLSITMSLQSFHSQIIQQDYCNQSQIINLVCDNENGDIQNQPALANYQIDNYQDALSILKNYNNGCGSLSGLQQENIGKENNKLSQSNVRKIGEERNKIKVNNAISKIKKMRKIQDLDMNKVYSLRDNSRKGTYVENKSMDKQEPVRSNTYKQKLMKEKTYPQLNHQSQHSSNHNIITLQQPIQFVNSILQHIQAVHSHPLHVSRIKNSLFLIKYQNCMEYQGHCDQNCQPSGYGKLVMKEEIVYQGEWRNGRFHGWGKLILIQFVKDMEKPIIQIDGNFRNGEIEGTVLCIFNNGERFMGTIHNKQIQMQGTLVGQKGISTGHWQNNRLLFLI